MAASNPSPLIIPPPRSNLFQAGVKQLFYTRLGAFFGSKLARKLDFWMLRLTNGRTTLAEFLTGAITIKLTTIGAKSGQPRMVPVLATPKGAQLVLIATNWGQKHYPAWYYNLIAHPTATVDYQGQQQHYSVEEVTGDLREACWDLAVRHYAGYTGYARRIKSRHIPVFLLTPVMPAAD